MANEIVRGGTGNFATRIETELGVSAATYRGIYLDATPTIPTNSRKLIENATKGFRNPMTRIAPLPVEIYRESAIRFGQRIRRADANGNAPNIVTFLESGGWQTDVGNVTVTAGAQGADSIVVSAAGSMAAGKAILVERDSGVHVPVLISTVAGTTLTPSIPMSSSAAEGASVEIMHTCTPTTVTGYQVNPAKTLQFRLNTLGYFNDAIGDLAFTFTGCALSDIAALEIGAVGTFPTLDMGFHVGDVAVGEVDIAADAHYDGSHFAVINSDAEFAFATYNDGSPIAALVAKCVEKLTFNLGIKTIPIPCVGGDGNVNGIQGYLLVQDVPSCTVVAYFRGDATFEKNWLTEVEGVNTSKYIHFIQPTRNLDHPAFGIWMPNCHIKADSEPTFDVAGDFIKVTATFEGTLANIGGASTDIDELAASPIYFAISGEAA